jgi:hypothetical protein
MTILVLFGICSEVAKRSMPSLHRSGNSQFDPGIWKPPCAEAILWDPNFSEYHLLHNELSKAILLRGHEQKLRAKNHYTYSRCRERGSFVVTFTALPGVPTTQTSPGKAIVPLLMSSAKAYSTIQSYFDEPLLECWIPNDFYTLGSNFIMAHKPGLHVVHQMHHIDSLGPEHCKQTIHSREGSAFPSKDKITTLVSTGTSTTLFPIPDIHFRSRR